MGTIRINNLPVNTTSNSIDSTTGTLNRGFSEEGSAGDRDSKNGSNSLPLVDDLVPQSPSGSGVGHRDAPSHASSTTDAVSELCLDAMIVALNDREDGKQWFESTVNLQLASLQFCTACRNMRSYHVRVPWGTPKWMWAPALHHRPSGVSGVLERYDKAPRRRLSPPRIPALEVRGMTWGPSTTGELFLENNDFMAGIESVVFGDHFNDGIGDVEWPQGLKRLAFGRAFNQEVAGVVWPASLRHLSFGNWFNQPLDSVVWPVSLETLTFGDLFNKPIDVVSWPPSLKKLTLGFCFDRPIAGVEFPASLERLEFGHNFNKPIDSVVWPPSLRRIKFGNYFNQDLDRVTWPPCLLYIRFGRKFDRRIDRASWPATLQQLKFGSNFNQAIDSVRWPSSLRQLTLGGTFDRPLQGVAWPQNLVEVVLNFRVGFHSHSLAGVQWPAGLQKLIVRAGVNLNGVVLPPRATLVQFSHR